MIINQMLILTLTILYLQECDILKQVDKVILYLYVLCIHIVMLFLVKHLIVFVYFELHSNKEINPNDIVDNRTDCEGQFNDEFIKEDELDNLW